MTVQECYEKINGDYEGVLGRFRGDARIQKFAFKFLDDGSYDSLCKTLEAGDYTEAFRAAHTLKGVCQNLGFTGLYQISEVLTEMLRSNPQDYTPDMLDKVRAEYDKTYAAIKELQASSGS
ncbi:MAG: Hpt domain-containing protein [Ruminococcus sp.]|jgi:chemotaxis protein histidine kinase CheA|nr:Hpt domain-containing protein [Ruminococcus sp.]